MTREDVLLAIREELGNDSIEESSPAYTMAIDSLDYLSLIQTLRERFGRIKTMQAANAHTIAELISAVTDA